MASSGMLRSVALVRTDVSEALTASFITVTRIVTLERTLFLRSVRRLLVTARVVSSSPILVTLMKEEVPSKSRFLQEPHGVTSQKTVFFIAAVVITPNLT
jgi:hypothetical protein